MRTVNDTPKVGDKYYSKHGVATVTSVTKEFVNWTLESKSGCTTCADTIQNWHRFAFNSIAQGDTFVPVKN